MEKRIRIRSGSTAVNAVLCDSATAAAVWAALPVEASASTWGDEIYFPVPVVQSLDDSAAEVVQVGDIGYWPSGKAFCIFFGPTPVSRGEEIRPASAVNIIGRVLDDARILKSVRDGDEVTIEPVP